MMKCICFVFMFFFIKIINRKFYFPLIMDIKKRLKNSKIYRFQYNSCYDFIMELCISYTLRYKYLMTILNGSTIECHWIQWFFFSFVVVVVFIPIFYYYTMREIHESNNFQGKTLTKCSWQFFLHNGTRENRKRRLSYDLVFVCEIDRWW